MFLNKRQYVGNKWKDKKDRVEVVDKSGKLKVKPERLQYVIEEVGYWRKANAIHQWFVTNVQDGKDDCKEYDVSREQLEELLEVVNKVLASTKLVKGKVHNGTVHSNGKTRELYEDGKIVKDASVAEELLPAQSGFFFGSTDYDQYYIQDLEYTKGILTEVLAEEGKDFTYQSSW